MTRTVVPLEALTVAPIAPGCAARAAKVRAWAMARSSQTYSQRPEWLGYRLHYDAHAAGEIPGPALQDARECEALAPDLAPAVWHHVAGATILGGYCCGTPASHRDALETIGRALMEGVRA